MRMASQGLAGPVYNEADLDDDVEPLNDVVLDDDEDERGGGGAADNDSSYSDTNSTASPSTTFASVPAIPAVPVSSVPAPGTATIPITGVNIAILPPSSSSFGPYCGDPSPPSTSIRNQVTAISAVTTERRQIDDPRRLFQRLWTDEDEIELLQGFFEYTAQRGPNLPGHHHDTAAFYDQIKSKLQLDCNKNQLVEKLRRLKKKYRTVVGRIRSGKDFVFKSPHDQATFKISSKIWSSYVNRPEFEDEDQNPTSNASTPVSINLNSAADHRSLMTSPYSIDINSLDKAAVVMNMGTPSGSRKRSRVKMEDKDSVKSFSFGGYDAVGGGGNSVHTSVEETVKSCLPSMVKELINSAFENATEGSKFSRGGIGGTVRDISSIALNAVPMNFSMVGGGRSGEAMDEKWRKQKILELEVYSKRLELVQDQIKSVLEELRSNGN